MFMYKVLQLIESIKGLADRLFFIGLVVSIHRNVSIYRKICTRLLCIYTVFDSSSLYGFKYSDTF